MIEKKQIIDLLDNIADILVFKSENSFKVNAYRMGAVAIRKHEGDIDELIRRKELNTIKGIGKGLQGVIYEFAESGTSGYLNELSEGVPKGIKELMRIKGLGPRKISYLFEQLNISDINDLENAARENKLEALKGFGPSLQRSILEEIGWIKTKTGYVLLDSALIIAEEVSTRIRAFKSIDKVTIAGSVVRKMEVIDTIEILVLVNNKEDFEEELNSYVKYIRKDQTYYINDVYTVEIKVITCTKQELVYKEFQLSCSEDFLKQLPKIKIKNYKSETEIFSELKLPFIIPEMREKEYFEFNKPRSSNLETRDLIGLLHFHTTYSDGRNSLEEMIEAAKSKGYLYAAVCDHSKSASYANGLNENRIYLQNKEIQRTSKKLNIPILRGIESDILVDGSLDFSNEILDGFQFIVASVHSRFSLSEEEMTQRIIKAIENPFTDIIGHISGRLLLSREPYKFDIDKALDACAKNNVAVEINSNPRRLDIDWRYIYKARDKGCIFSINADAHSIAEIDLIKYGIMMGRKAGLQKEEVINCFNYEKFIKFLNVKRKRN